MQLESCDLPLACGQLGTLADTVSWNRTYPVGHGWLLREKSGSCHRRWGNGCWAGRNNRCPCTPARQSAPAFISHLSPQLTETICTELVNDFLLPHPRTFFSLYLQFLTPLTSASLENLSSLGFCITNQPKT